MSNDQLKNYREKRNFNRTTEPSDAGERKDGQNSWFVIQKHDASTLHYDFRLEMGDVLKSWAVPKGPSTDPREKRLAIRTEDHPLSYIDFEGVIPEGEYGAGTVMVWDTGPYQNLREEKEQLSIEDSLKEGKIEVRLEGEKIKGGIVLIRTDSGENEKWLMIKMDDEEADARRNPTSTEPESVISNRKLEEIKKDNSDE